jgi:hypothetical protein
MFWVALSIILVVFLLGLVVLSDRRNPFQLIYKGQIFFRIRSKQFRDERGQIVADHCLIDSLEEHSQKMLTDRSSEVPTFWPK